MVFCWNNKNESLFYNFNIKIRMFEFQKFYRNKFWLGKTCEFPGLEKTSMYFGSLIGQSNPFSNINFNFHIIIWTSERNFTRDTQASEKRLRQILQLSVNFYIIKNFWRFSKKKQAAYFNLYAPWLQRFRDSKLWMMQPENWKLATYEEH